MKLLGLIRKQKEYRIVLNDGSISITDPLLYYSTEQEIVRESEKVGRENKKRIIAECKAKVWKIPNFRKEGSGFPPFCPSWQ